VPDPPVPDVLAVEEPAKPDWVSPPHAVATIATHGTTTRTHSRPKRHVTIVTSAAAAPVQAPFPRLRRYAASSRTFPRHVCRPPVPNPDFSIMPRVKPSASANTDRSLMRTRY